MARKLRRSVRIHKRHAAKKTNDKMSLASKPIVMLEGNDEIKETKEQYIYSCKLPTTCDEKTKAQIKSFLDDLLILKDEKQRTYRNGQAPSCEIWLLKHKIAKLLDEAKNQRQPSVDELSLNENGNHQLGAKYSDQVSSSEDKDMDMETTLTSIEVDQPEKSESMNQVCGNFETRQELDPEENEIIAENSKLPEEVKDTRENSIEEFEAPSRKYSCEVRIGNYKHAAEDKVLKIDDQAC